MKKISVAWHRLENNGQATLQYGDTEHLHAATSAGANSYDYDENGSMIFRFVDGVQTDLTYDEEGRLTGVESSGTPLVTPTPWPSSTPAPIFADVPYGNPYKPHIEAMYTQSITGGCSSNPLNFYPAGSVTRGQMAVFMLRAKHGSAYTPPAVGSSTGFNDVPTSHTFAAWIKQFAAEGFSSGCGGGNFCPDANVTRAHAAIFFLRAKYGSSYAPPAVGSSTGFNDVPTNHTFAAWIKQIAAEGALNGCGGGNFCPDSAMTREQTAYFLASAFDWVAMVNPRFASDPNPGRAKMSFALPPVTPDLSPSPSPVGEGSATPTWTPTPFFTATFPSRSFDPVSEIFSSAQFTYDGDGRRVKSVITTNVGSTTTFFVGAHYEVVVTDTGTQVNKYYFAESQRIAMRQNGTLYYILGDHLGSTSIVTDAAGTVVSQTRYKAWGEVRHQSGVTPTEYQFTSQYSYAGEFGLLFYNARMYDPALKRFISADTIVPPVVQGLDRYAYVNNSPMNYVDPTGHVACSSVAEEDCSFEEMMPEEVVKRNIKSKYNITMSDEGEKAWSLQNLRIVFSGLQKINNALNGKLFRITLIS